jgi:hypothetical protein
VIVNVPNNPKSWHKGMEEREAEREQEGQNRLGWGLESQKAKLWRLKSKNKGLKKRALQNLSKENVEHERQGVIDSIHVGGEPVYNPPCQHSTHSMSVREKDNRSKLLTDGRLVEEGHGRSQHAYEQPFMQDLTASKRVSGINHIGYTHTHTHSLSLSLTLCPCLHTLAASRPA